MNELAQAIHDAMEAVGIHNKAATVTLTMEIKPIGTQGVANAVGITGKVAKKLPEAELPTTLFFRDSDGNPTRSQKESAEPEFPGLHVAGAAKGAA